jgi:hypothetical protein
VQQRLAALGQELLQPGNLPVSRHPFLPVLSSPRTNGGAETLTPPD